MLNVIEQAKKAGSGWGAHCKTREHLWQNYEIFVFLETFPPKIYLGGLLMSG